MQIFVFPALQRRFSNVPLYAGLISLWVLVFATFPVTNIIARVNRLADGTVSREGEAGVFVSVIVMLMLAKVAYLTSP